MNRSVKSDGRTKPEPVDGLLLLNKPAGITSNQVLQKVKRLLRAKKAGHTGSLDPAATGMLPLCFGEATKVCAFLLEADKTYRVVARLGEATDTGDGDGTVVTTADVPNMTANDWRRILDRFTGPIMQVPPMYSALKKDGKRLYELARKGQVVERDARPVTIHSIELLESAGSRLVLQVACSKGTYIRTLVEDIAAAAGTVAYAASLHRETVGGFSADEMIDYATAEKMAEVTPEPLRARLLSPDTVLAGWPMIELTALESARFVSGQVVPMQPGLNPGLIRVYEAAGRFLGVGEVAADGGLIPKRNFNLPAGTRNVTQAGNAQEPTSKVEKTTNMAE